MKRDPKNMLHDWKAARMERSYLSQVEFLGSGIRVSFLRAWLVTALKVMLIFAFMNFHIDVASKMEESVLLLDKYIHNDFQIDTSPMRVANARLNPSNNVVTKIVTVNLEPRGPNPNAAVAGESTTVPD